MILINNFYSDPDFWFAGTPW